ncbi:alpha-glucosidase [Sporothrix brasiliensis 5110]|uniref:alpha-glucosidase n=1 Tax=Sporothrix brasiliensis 5110 TaxID=1398154 RepID=A0A0C2JAG1_9PEZI|nr:alpha-glucosidase [Sporothrix brasiliensis 5110]KIH93902.1 alpha-glucosidase [Sporothrix brasiliensis 5110]
MLHQFENTPQQYALQEPASASAPSVALRSTEAVNGNHFDFTFEAVRPGVFRTTFASPSHPLPPFPSAKRVETSSSVEVPKTSLDAASKTFSVVSADVTATVDWSGAPIVSLTREGVARPLYRDMAYRSYVVDGPGVAHYSSYKKDDLYVGLGEKAGPMNLAGRGFQITASDTFGYDALLTDPLYKHIPLLLHVSRPAPGQPSGPCVGLFSTSHSRGTWNVGSEIDGMWGHFKVYRQAYGGLEQYLLVGHSVAEVVRLYADVVGYPLLTPRYMMGYVSGGMKYTMEDEPRAADVIVGFLDKCAAHDIPVSAFQMSSGYTIAEQPPKTRNVFTWNYHRFPDPRAFTAACHKRGVRLLANIKPYVLANHPAYPGLKAANAFFKDPSAPHKDKDGGDALQTGVARLWSAGGGESGEGSHIDFTSKAGFQWWYDGAKALKGVGIDAMWNDNNEYNIFSDDWECALETVPIPASLTSRKIGLWGRAMHTELMGKSSYDACADAVPDERPLVLTRSATAGTMRYACSSWSGDNVTSWDGMRGANAMSLNAGVSLLQCYGHDIGGFEGPQPTPEHLVRWVQIGVHQPRFAINCYKTSEDDNLVGGVIEPWMHPTATPLVRAAIKRRYELVPYTYSGALQSHLTAPPSMRWTGWGYETDPEVWTAPLLAGDTQFWFGDALLVGGDGIYVPGSSEARVYLPTGDATAAGFLNVNAPHEWLPAGQWHTISSAWHASIPVLARCGSAVPVGRNLPTTSRKNGRHAEAEQTEFPSIALDDWRGVEVYPAPATVSGGAGGAKDSTFTTTWLEDDGISAEGRSPIYEISVAYTPSAGAIEVAASAAPKMASTAQGDDVPSSWAPLWLSNGLDVILPVGEERVVKAAGGQAVEDKGRDTKGRRVYHIAVKV